MTNEPQLWSVLTNRHASADTRAEALNALLQLRSGSWGPVPLRTHVLTLVRYAVARRQRLGVPANSFDEEAITQDTLMDLWRKGPKIRIPALKWLSGAVRISVLRANREVAKDGKIAPITDDLVDPNADPEGNYQPTPEQIERGIRIEKIIRRAVSRLTPPHRAVAELFLFEALRPVAIAATLGIKPNTAVVRLKRARTELHHILRRFRRPSLRRLISD